MLVPILLHYFWLCCAHDCNVDAHANNIPTLFITAVLCPILCKRKLLTQRLKAKFLLHPQLGGTSGVYMCTYVLQVHWLWMYSCLVSARALTSLYRQYRGRQNHCQKLAPDQSGALKKLTSAPTKPLTHNYDHYIMMIEDVLPFVLNTKQPLHDIWLLRYKQNSFGCFWKKSEFQFFHKTPKTVLFITDQPNIAQRPFCIQNERQDILYHLI